MLTHDTLLDLLDYNKDTGLFTWKQHRGRVTRGSPAGSINDKGYLQIRVNGKIYLAHRLAWFYENMELLPPSKVIDHINRNPLDNRLTNLRVVTQAENLRNRVDSKTQTNITYIKFVTNSKFHVQLGNKFKRKWVGTFKTIEEACIALLNTYTELNYQEGINLLKKECAACQIQII